MLFSIYKVLAHVPNIENWLQRAKIRQNKTELYKSTPLHLFNLLDCKVEIAIYVNI